MQCKELYTPYTDLEQKISLVHQYEECYDHIYNLFCELANISNGNNAD